MELCLLGLGALAHMNPSSYADDSDNAFASKSQLAYAEFQYYKYLSHQDDDPSLSNNDSETMSYTEMTKIDETSVRQRDGKIVYLKSQLDRTPTQGNVYALVDEIKDRHMIEHIFQAVFADSFGKEKKGEDLVTQPRDFACMRTVHSYLNSECDDVMSREYSL